MNDDYSEDASNSSETWLPPPPVGRSTWPFPTDTEDDVVAKDRNKTWATNRADVVERCVRELGREPAEDTLDQNLAVVFAAHDRGAGLDDDSLVAALESLGLRRSPALLGKFRTPVDRRAFVRQARRELATSPNCAPQLLALFGLIDPGPMGHLAILQHLLCDPAAPDRLAPAEFHEFLLEACLDESVSYSDLVRALLVLA